MSTAAAIDRLPDQISARAIPSGGPVEHKARTTDAFQATLEAQRRAWIRKPLLRRVYHGYYRRLLAQCSPLRPIVEIGSGGGFFKEFCPEVISTDIAKTPWADRVVNGCSLPFGDDSVGNLVLIDVFHHLDRPAAFLTEASRVLKHGGRILMLEPWTSAVGYPFYRYIHRERADRHVDPEAPFATEKAAFDGNPALPKLYFGDASPGSRVRSAGVDLQVVEVRPLPGTSWLISGGFSAYALLPGCLWPLAELAEILTTPLAKIVGLRAVIALERSRPRRRKPRDLPK